jgi:hypothetical protein
VSDDTKFDPVSKPKHYNSHPSGLQPIEFTAYMSFCLGNAAKYVVRCDLKGTPVEDLEKALWYLNHEIKLREDGKAILVDRTEGQTAFVMFVAHEPSEFARRVLEELWEAGRSESPVQPLRVAEAILEIEIARRKGGDSDGQ